MGADLADVVDFVAQGPSVVAVVNRGLAREVKWIMSRVIGGHLNLGLASVSVVEMSVFKEADAFRTELVFVPLHSLESTLILRLARETSIARLEVRAGDVGLGELIEALIDLPGSAKCVLEGNLGVYHPFETVVSRNLNAICLNLGLVYFVFVVWGVD